MLLACHSTTDFVILSEESDLVLAMPVFYRRHRQRPALLFKGLFVSDDWPNRTSV